MIVGSDATSTTAKLEVHGDVSAEYYTATSSTATSTLPRLLVTTLALGSDYVTDLTGTGLVLTSGVLSIDPNGDWTGTFDGQEGSYYLANSFSTTSADYWETQQTPRTADNLADNTLNDLGDVATTSVALGDLLAWNGTSWTDVATSTLNLSTTNLTEGNNLFYTNGRVASYINSNGSIPHIQGSADGDMLVWRGMYFWVVDYTDDDVYRYNANGAYSSFSFDTFGSGNTSPYGITWDGTYFWTTDLAGAEVYRYNADGTYSSFSFDTAGSGNSNPFGITWDGTYLWVTDGSDAEVYRYTANGTYSSFSFDTAGGGNGAPDGIAWDGTYFWITDDTDDEVYRYTANGTYSGFSFDTAGRGKANPPSITL